MNKIILYAKGKDRSGIISEISEIINKFNGNIEITKMIKLESHFNILALIQIQKDKINKLENKLNQITNLYIEINETKKLEEDTNRLFYFRLKGADNEGIVHIFTNYLYKQNINILDLESEITNAPVTGHQLFLLKSKLLLPNKIDAKIIKNELIRLSNINNVVIKFEKFNNSMDY